MSVGKPGMAAASYGLVHAALSTEVCCGIAQAILCCAASYAATSRSCELTL